MKTILKLLFFSGCLAIVSCNDDDEFTIEDADVTGSIAYVQTKFVPLKLDSTGMIPLEAEISFSGVGTLNHIGNVTMTSTFKFDFIAGKGSDFKTTYTSDQGNNSFDIGGNSQLQPDGSFLVDEMISSGKGKFSKIKGGGTTLVVLDATRTAGTGTVNWKVTY